ncbi:MAG: hypothetical protein K9H41_05920 [Bacteroidia bacterium]|nr:hypothetical protein [Bacteroidia bacterium]
MKKEYNIKDQASAIRHFIEQMDIEMIDAFLDAKNTYQDMEKEKFLSKLERVFQSFRNFSDTFLLPHQGRCNNCYNDKVGYTFVGNFSFNYISIIVDSEKGTINDMFECSSFMNDNQSLKLNKKVYIDDFFIDFLSSKRK